MSGLLEPDINHDFVFYCLSLRLEKDDAFCDITVVNSEKC